MKKSLQHPDSFLFQPLCCGFSNVLELLSSYISQFVPSFSSPMSKYTVIQRGSCSTQWLHLPRYHACKISPNHDSCTTIPETWFELFVLIFCVWCLPNGNIILYLCYVFKHSYFSYVCPKLFCFVHMCNFRPSKIFSNLRICHIALVSICYFSEGCNEVNFLGCPLLRTE